MDDLKDQLFPDGEPSLEEFIRIIAEYIKVCDCL